MSLIPRTYTYESYKIRTQVDDFGNPWFVAADICSVLNIQNLSVSVSKLDEDEKNILSLGCDSATFVNESGLFSLINSSKKAEAKAFKRWVISSLITAVRQSPNQPGSPASVQLLVDSINAVLKQNEKLAGEIIRRIDECEAQDLSAGSA